MRNNVKCRSGLRGWQSRLQEVYANFEEFLAYAETFGTHLKLGFKLPAKLGSRIRWFRDRLNRVTSAK